MPFPLPEIASLRQPIHIQTQHWNWAGRWVMCVNRTIYASRCHTQMLGHQMAPTFPQKRPKLAQIVAKGKDQLYCLGLGPIQELTEMSGLHLLMFGLLSSSQSSWMTRTDFPKLALMRPDGRVTHHFWGETDFKLLQSFQ